MRLRDLGRQVYCIMWMGPALFIHSASEGVPPNLVFAAILHVIVNPASSAASLSNPMG